MFLIKIFFSNLNLILKLHVQCYFFLFNSPIEKIQQNPMTPWKKDKQIVYKKYVYHGLYIHIEFL